jgi:predicted CXXCH cytochrome family protein
MRKPWVIAVLISGAVAAVVFALSGKPHEFSSKECMLCHIDEKNEPGVIRPSVSAACETCHSDLEDTQSHPVDLYPSLKIPGDMLLVDGMFTCVTCHYVHPDEKKNFLSDQLFLRRQVRGFLFCSICHEIDEKGHIVLGKVHSGTYTVLDSASGIDRMSLDCIECHDMHFKESLDFLGAGLWEHSSKNSHPIGVSYEKSSMKKMRDYRPSNTLRKGIRFFNGNIGCGTCHSIYSKRRNMLVMENTGSRLCRECHLK